MRKIVDLRTVRLMTKIEQLKRKTRISRMGQSGPEKTELDLPRPFELLYSAQVLKGISRDFNDLLTCIQGYISLMLLDMEPGRPGYKNLKDMELCVQKGAALTMQLSNTGEAIKPNKETVRINDLIRAQFHEFGKGKGQFVFRQRYQEGIWPIRADIEDIERIIRMIRDDLSQGLSTVRAIYIRTQNVILSEAYVRPQGLAPGQFVKISIAYTSPGEGEQRAAVSESRTARAHDLMKKNGGFLHAFKGEENGKTIDLYFPA